MSDMTIQLPNSPGVDVHIDRGGTDPITGEVFGDNMVRVSWEQDDNFEVRYFTGPH